MNSGENYRMMTAGGNSEYSRVIQLLNWLAKDKLSILTFQLPFFLFKGHKRRFKPLILNAIFDYFVTSKIILWTKLLKVLTWIIRRNNTYPIIKVLLCPKRTGLWAESTKALLQKSKSNRHTRIVLESIFCNDVILMLMVS